MHSFFSEMHWLCTRGKSIEWTTTADRCGSGGAIDYPYGLSRPRVSGLAGSSRKGSDNAPASSF